MTIYNFRCSFKQISRIRILFCITLVLGWISSPNNMLKAEEDKVLARVANITITEKDLEARLNKIPENQKIIYETERGKEELLLEMVRLEVFYQEAVKQKLDQDSEYQAKIQRIEKGLLAAAFVKQKILKDIEIGESETRQYYQNHTDEFIEPEKIKVQSIFFLVSEKQSIDVATAKADAILKQIQNGEDFTDLSEQFSENTTPIKQDYFARGRLNPTIEDDVFRLNVGEISPILQVDDGLIIFRLEDRILPKTLLFDEVKDEIVKQLKKEKEKNAFYSTERQLFEAYNVSFKGKNQNQMAMDDKNKKPDIQGIINRISREEQQGKVSINMLEIKDYHIQISPETTVFEKNNDTNEKSSVDQLEVGQKVYVYFSGPVLQSYPPQAKAARIVIVDHRKP